MVIYLAYLTGIARTASGHVNLANVSGDMIWNNDNLRWEGLFIITDPDDHSLYTTGFADWEWNSGGVSGATGIEAPSGIITFRNAGGTAWDAISNTNAAIDNADAQHTHVGVTPASGATQLDQLTDVTIKTDK